MQRSPSEGRGPPLTNARSPARDPRIRVRNSSTHGLDRDTDAARGRATERRDSLRWKDDSPSNSTPQSTTSRLDNAAAVLNGPPDLQKAFARHSRLLQDIYFLGRKRNSLRRDRDHAQAEYEKLRKNRDKFPVVVEQLERQKTDAENEYNAVKQEETNARGAEESSATTFVRMFEDAIKGKDEAIRDKDEVIKEKDARYDALAEQVAAMQREMQDIRSQQAKTVAQHPPTSDDTKNRIQKLETFCAKQHSDNTTFKALDDKLKTSKRNVEDLRADHTKANDASRRQIEELRRKIDKDATQAINALKSEVEALRQRVGTLEHGLFPIESQLQESQNQRAAEKDQLQQIQEASEAQRLASDSIERLRRSIHLKVETMGENIKDGISNFKAEISSINSEVATLNSGHSKHEARLSNLEASTSPGMPASAPFDTELESLKRINQEQSERVAALDTSVEEIADKVGSLEADLNARASHSSSTTATQELAALRSLIAKGDKDWKSLGEKVNREMELIKQQMTKDTTKSQSPELGALSTEVNALKDRIVEHTTRCAQFEEKHSAEVESLTAQLSERSDIHSGSISKLEKELTKYAVSRTKSEAQRDTILTQEMERIERELQREQTATKAALAQLPQIQEAVNVATNVEKLEAQVDALQKNQEKQAHLFLGLNQRFNNLTTETLARQMMSVANKSLPKMEKSLQKIEGELQELRQKVDTPVKDVISAEVGEKFRSVEENLEELEMKFQTQYDALGKNYEDGAAEAVEKIRSFEGDLEEMRTKFKTQHDTLTKDVEDGAAEVEEKFQSVERTIEELGTKFQAQHDTLAKNFEDGRDKIVKDIKLLEESAARHETSQSTYRESTAKDFKAFETRLDALNSEVDNIGHRVEGVKSREHFPREDRKNMSFDADGVPKSNGWNGISTQARLGSHSVTQKNKPHISHSNSNSGTPSSRIVQDSEDDEDNDVQEGDRLLKAFTKPPPQQQTSHSSLRQLPRKGSQPSAGSSKRKRSPIRDGSNEFDISVKGRASKEARR
ncbi:hypothetical protein H2200_010643 [Cladophialophora chaetospira]|uniref:Uncharacterized protein n=1 Tax=Cladophialophora chaetospira TaxID=386627 RepID=A0AA38X0H9_9EURO|nr:hypothetical protein H2200_010643 [Cladophialophora chaetospira]